MGVPVSAYLNSHGWLLYTLLRDLFYKSRRSNIDTDVNVWPSGGLSACIFLLRLLNLRSLFQSSHWCKPAAKRISLQSLTLLKSVHPCTLFNDEFFALQKTRCCLEPPTSMSVLTESYPCQCLDMSLLIANSLLHGTTDFHVGTKCTSLYTFQRRVFCKAKNSLLLETTAIRGRTDGNFLQLNRAHFFPAFIKEVRN